MTEPLCALEDIPDGGSARFSGTVNGEARSLMAIRQGNTVHVYVNSCPHTGAPLDFTPGQFLDVDRRHILCTNHGALFRIEDGYCLKGPCSGDNLQAVRTEIQAGIVHLVD